MVADGLVVTVADGIDESETLREYLWSGKHPDLITALLAHCAPRRTTEPSRRGIRINKPLPLNDKAAGIQVDTLECQRLSSSRLLSNTWVYSHRFIMRFMMVTVGRCI